MHCNLRSFDVEPVVLGSFGRILLRMHTNCYISVSDQNSDIIIKFIDPDFLNKKKQ